MDVLPCKLRARATYSYIPKDCWPNFGTVFYKVEGFKPASRTGFFESKDISSLDGSETRDG